MGWPRRDHAPPADDVGVLWFGNGVDLCRQVQEFIGDIRGTRLGADEIADRLWALLAEPRPALPQLGDPPPPGGDVVMPDEDCARRELHTGGQPAGRLAWDAWAEKMSATHHQRQCPGCRRFQIWEPKPEPGP